MKSKIDDLYRYLIGGDIPPSISLSCSFSGRHSGSGASGTGALVIGACYITKVHVNSVSSFSTIKYKPSGLSEVTSTPGANVDIVIQKDVEYLRCDGSRSVAQDTAASGSISITIYF